MLTAPCLPTPWCNHPFRVAACTTPSSVSPATGERQVHPVFDNRWASRGVGWANNPWQELFGVHMLAWHLLVWHMQETGDATRPPSWFDPTRFGRPQVPAEDSGGARHVHHPQLRQGQDALLLLVRRCEMLIAPCCLWLVLCCLKAIGYIHVGDLARAVGTFQQHYVAWFCDQTSRGALHLSLLWWITLYRAFSDDFARARMTRLMFNAISYCGSLFRGPNELAAT